MGIWRISIDVHVNATWIIQYHRPALATVLAALARKNHPSFAQFIPCDIRVLAIHLNEFVAGDHVSLFSHLG
jgi:hypothetical protein